MGALIDLGDVSRTAEGPGHRQFRAALLRRIVVAAIAIACLGGLTAAEPAPEPWHVPLWMAPSARPSCIEIGVRNLYSLDHDTVVALDVETGTERWRVRFDRRPLYAMDFGYGVTGVMLIHENPTIDTGDQVRFALVDEATGAVLGDAAGGLVGVTPSGRVVLASVRRPVYCSETESCTEVTSFDLRSRRRVWRAQIPGELIGNVSEEIHWFAIASPDGSVAIYDADSGTLMQRLEPPAPPAAKWYSVMDQFVIAVVQDTTGWQIAAYRAGSTMPTRTLEPPERSSFDPLWTLELPERITREPWHDRSYVSRCGGNLCLMLGGPTFIIEAATGRLLATLDLEVVGELGGGLLLAGLPPDVNSADGSDIYVFDPYAGRALATFFPGSWPVRWAESRGRALVIQRRPGRTGFTILNEHGIAWPLPAVAVDTIACTVRADVLACWDPYGVVRVWRLPRARRHEAATAVGRRFRHRRRHYRAVEAPRDVIPASTTSRTRSNCSHDPKSNVSGATAAIAG